MNYGSLIQDCVIVLQLVILEGLLSFDNALALAAMVKKRLKDPVLQRRALTWGLWGAYLFRTIVIFAGVWLMQQPWIKVAAGAYLVWIAVDELFLKNKASADVSGSATGASEVEASSDNNMGGRGRFALVLGPFWSTVVSVELMDIMFSIDSVSVALALSRKVWVLILGAVLGILMMRLAAQMFVHLIGKLPILLKTAFVLVGIAGVNILLETKNLPLPFTDGKLLTIDMAIPETPFLIILFAVFLGSIALNLLFPAKFASKEQ